MKNKNTKKENYSAQKKSPEPRFWELTETELLSNTFMNRSIEGSKIIRGNGTEEQNRFLSRIRRWLIPGTVPLKRNLV